MAEQEFVSKVSRARVDREARSKDFGNMTTKMPKAIVRPKSVEEVCGIVGMAIRDEFELAVRGGRALSRRSKSHRWWLGTRHDVSEPSATSGT